MGSFSALLWDVDGALFETERDGHRLAFNEAFADFGLPWHWSVERYGELLAITGARERLQREMSERQDGPLQASARDALARRLHARKTERYADLLARRPLTLRSGVAALVDECLARGVRMGITTRTNRANVDILLRSHWGEDWSRWFCVVVCGEEVQCRKPHPEAFVRALLALRMVPSEVVAIEDSPAGLAAARAVDIPVIVARSACFAQAKVHGAIAVGLSLGQRCGWQPTLDCCAGSVGRVELADIAYWAELASAHRVRDEATARFSRVSAFPTATAHESAAGSP